MAKRTAVIDIGSNSARMAVYEKETRFAFSLIKEIKSRVRISEGAYENRGKLQNFAIKRAINALDDFLRIAKSMQCRKIICIATSAVRDAPNANLFIKEAKQRLNLNIRIIDGNKEAALGALAVINMLPKLQDATIVDIGGGSTELAKIENGKIIKTISIDIGTVRLKELFFDKKALSSDIEKFISKKIKDIDKTFGSSTIVGVGGTVRALGKLIIAKTDYPLSTIHGFEYSSKSSLELILKIARSNILSLKSIGIKKDRYDTIREGCAIFGQLIKRLGSEKIITSGVGIREGAYLSDILRSSGGIFPPNFHLSLESLKARFACEKKESRFLSKCVKNIFETLKPQHKLKNDFLKELLIAAELSSIGRHLSFYQEHIYSAYFIMNNLNYGFTHREKVLISFIVKFHDKKVTENDIFLHKNLLPNLKDINWLVFMFSLSKILFSNGASKIPQFEFSDNFLHITSEESLILAKATIKKMSKPDSFAIVVN